MSHGAGTLWMSWQLSACCAVGRSLHVLLLMDHFMSSMKNNQPDLFLQQRCLSWWNRRVPRRQETGGSGVPLLLEGLAKHVIPVWPALNEISQHTLLQESLTWISLHFKSLFLTLLQREKSCCSSILCNSSGGLESFHSYSYLFSPG